MRRSIGTLLVLGSVMALACGRDSVGPEGTQTPSFEILDGAHLGNGNFYFLPPLVGQPAYSGVANTAASPRVVVCEWDGVTCLSVVASFGMNDGTGSEVIRYDGAGQLYLVNWHTDTCLSGPCSLDPSKTYRLRVLVGAVELGHADLDVVSNGRDLKNVETNEYIGLVDGRTLPVKFRIELGAVAVLEPGGSASVDGSGGLVTTTDGSVGLEFPEGALNGVTAITVSAVDAPPEGAEPWAPVVELGPDGTVFGEPAILTLAYAPESLPEDVPATALAIYTFDGTGWDLVPDGIVNEADNTISAPIAHFSFYGVFIRPNYSNLATEPTTLTVGQSTHASVTVYFFPDRGLARPAVNRAVYWYSDRPDIAPVALGPTYTDRNGVAVSPAITGRAPGAADIWSFAGDRRSEDLRITVLPSLGLFVTGDPFSGPRNDTFREMGIDQAFSLVVYTPAPVPADLQVALTHSATGITSAAGTAVITAGTASRGVAVQGVSEGYDTLIVSAPGFGPDTVVIRVGVGKMMVVGWPSSLAFGDSAAIRIRPVNPPYTIVDNAYNTTFALAPNSALQFTDGTAAITSIAVPGGTSSTPEFYVKAIGSGTGRATFSSPNYVEYADSIAVGAPPTIRAVPSTLTIPVQRGSSNSAEIQITNTGGGTLSGLFTGPFSNYFNGSPAPWVTASLSSTTAPATLTITASPDASVGVGAHQLRFDLLAPGATNSPVTFYSINITVIQEDVPPVNATIVANPGSLAFSAVQGRVASRSISITNSGTDPLTDLTVGSFSNYYNGSPAPWVTATVSPTTAPATITVQAAPDATVGLGTHRLRFDVLSPGATNSPYTFYAIDVTVEPGPTWSQVAPIPTPRYGAATVAMGNSIYVIGGNASPASPYPGGPTVRTVEAFDVVTGQWTPKASLPIALEYSNVVAYGGLIYVFGGWQANLAGSSVVFTYDPGTDVWTQQANAPYSVFGGVAAAIDGRIYMTLTACCGSPGSVFRALEPVSGTWSTPAPMPHGHDFPAGGGVIDGKLYVVGGYGVTSYLDVYDPSAGSWTTKAQLPVTRHQGAGVVIDGRLYVFGGAGESPLDAYVYDPSNDGWSIFAAIPGERNLLGAAAVNGTAYLIGGTGPVSPNAPISAVDVVTP